MQGSSKFTKLYSLRKTQDISPFLASDFRGLLIADYNEALKNWDTADYNTLINTNSTSLSEIKQVRRKSNATKELFPSPYDLTKFNLEGTMSLKKSKGSKMSNTTTGFYKSPQK